MKIRRWSRFGFALSLSAVLMGSLAPASFAGTAAVNNSEEGSSTGTTSFAPSGVTTTLSPAQVTAVTQNVLSEVSAAIDSGNSNIIGTLQTALAGTSISIADVQAAIGALQSLLDQAEAGQTTLRSRRPTDSSLPRTNLRATLLEYGSTTETADLTVDLLNNLEIDSSSNLVVPVAELTLTMQGLATDSRMTSERLLTSIEAFNVLVNSLSPEQLVVATGDTQIQAIKALLEGFSNSGNWTVQAQ